MSKILLSGIKIIISNPVTKLMALLLALVVWFYINQEYTGRSEPFDVPLELDLPHKTIGEAFDLSGNRINTVRVILEGPRGLLKKNPEGIICRHKVDLIPTQPKTEVIETLTIEDFNLPAQINLKDVSPNKIRLILMQETQKYMRIKADNCLVGSLAQGYEVVGVKANPSEVLVRGPIQVIEHANEIAIVPVDISGRTSSFTQPGRIVETIDNMPVRSDDLFTVEVNIKEELLEKTFKAKVNILLPPDFPYQVKTKPAELEVKLKGSAVSLKNLKEHHINLFVNVSALYGDPAKIKPGNYTIKVEFGLTSEAPEEIILVEPLPPVTLEVIETTKSTLPE